MSDQLAIPGIPEEFDIGDELDRCYTPDALAEAMTQWVYRDLMQGAEPAVVIEPSVGGGAFVRAARRAWPNAVIIGCDVDPDAAGLPLCQIPFTGDWPKLALSILGDAFAYGGCVLVLGNPPFGEAVDHWEAGPLADARVAADKETQLYQALIMPLACLGVSKWGEPLSRVKPSRVRPILGRPWPKRVRETAVYWRFASRLPENSKKTELVLPALSWKGSW